MSEAKHTPGPWQVMGGERLVWVSAHLAGPSDICDLYHYSAKAPENDGFVLKENAEANAHLIAAAPDLLEALEGLWDVVEGAIQSGDWQIDGACDPDAELHRAERAIKKAKGLDR